LGRNREKGGKEKRKITIGNMGIKERKG